jgi:PAS domain S-box-containing protein
MGLEFLIMIAFQYLPKLNETTEAILDATFLSAFLSYPIWKWVIQPHLLFFKRNISRHLEELKIGMWEYDSSSNKVIWDSNMNRLWSNIDPVNTLDDWAKRIHPDDRKVFLNLFNSTDSKQKAINANYRVIIDIKEFVFSTTGSAFVGANGAISIFAGFCLDITESVKMPESLAKSEIQFRIIYDSAPLGIIQLDKDRKFLRANKFYQDMLGYSEEELKTKSIFDVTPPDDIETTNLASKKLHSKEFILKNLIKRIIKKNGDIIWTDVTSTAFDDTENGQVLISLIQDITKKRETETNLLHSSKMASLGEMASNIAHEINNPLTIIIGKTSHIEKKLANLSSLDEDLLKDLTKIKFTTNRISIIVKGLRNFSRSADNDPFIQSSIRTVFNETLSLCQEKFKNSQVILEIDEIPDFPIQCRPTKISQVLINLLNNSFDAISNLNEKWIKIIFKSLEDRFRINLIDSGKGIPEKIAKNLMQPFYTTKEVGKGTGLGLSISQGIILDHKGQFYLNRKNSPRPRSF